MSWWKLVVGVSLAVLSTLGTAATLEAADGLVPHIMHVSLPAGSRQVTLWLEPGFEIGVAASGLPDARVLAQSPTGELVLSQHYQGRVVKLSDPDGDGVVDEIVPPTATRSALARAIRDADTRKRGAHTNIPL